MNHPKRIFKLDEILRLKHEQVDLIAVSDKGVFNPCSECFFLNRDCSWINCSKHHVHFMTVADAVALKLVGKAQP